MSLTDIKSAIEELSVRERCELNAWLQNSPDDEWDRQMREDAEPGGKLHKLMQAAEQEAADGKLRDFPPGKA